MTEPTVEHHIQPLVAATPEATAGTPPEDAPSTPRPETVVRLWRPRDLAIISFLLGFPGGFGLVAGNAYRLGNRPMAYLTLLVGAGILLLLVFLPIDLSAGAAVGLNTVLVVALFVVMKRQVESVSGAGGRVERASGPGGLATFIGGWIVTAAPSLLLLTTLSFLGGQAQAVRAGTMEFGSGTDCVVDEPITAATTDQSVHFVAYLTREVQPGATITVHTSVAGTAYPNETIDIAAVSDCVAGTFPPRTYPAGTYTFEFTVGSERLALGTFLITEP